MKLRDFLGNDDSQFVTVNIADPEHEIASYVRESCDVFGPAIYVADSGVDPDGHRMAPVVGGVYAATSRIKQLLGLDADIHPSDLDAVKRYIQCATVQETELTIEEMVEDYQEGYFAASDGVEHIEVVEDAECQEFIYEDMDEFNLDYLPICTHNELDAGPFITAGVQVVEWFDGTQGLGIHRMMKVDDRHLGCLAPPNRRVGLPHYRDSENGGEGVKMAVVIGAPPSVVLASQAKVNQRTEKYLVAANIEAIHGHKLKLTKCITSDLLVPAEAELVLECTTVPNSSVDDTPFAEYPGTYSFRSNAFKVRVDAITHREGYVYQTILTGKLPQEDSNLCAIPYSAEVYRVAAGFVEEVTDIAAFLGNNVFDSIVCIKKSSDSEVENLLHQLLGNKYLKSITIMDDDLKANEKDWRFAFNTRYQPNRNTIITNLGLGASLDPSSPLFQSTSKIGLDFTVPCGKTPEERRMNRSRHAVVKTHPDVVLQPYVIHQIKEKSGS
jgi:2,5-furandicarboxylate decarboxylase 1